MTEIYWNPNEGEPLEHENERTLEQRRHQRSESRQSQTFHALLDYVCRVGGIDEQMAERGLVSVLCVLEQRLIGHEPEHLEAQLPQKLRDLLVRCERHIYLRPRDIGREEFLALVGQDLGLAGAELEHLVRAVFQGVRAQVSEGEVNSVEAQLPHDLRDLWRATV